MLRVRLTALLAALAMFTATARAQDKTDKVDRTKAAPVVDVVLCLDVSSSMNELIDSAKVKLWDIVNDLGKVKPTPKLRVGLYSYGHLNYDAKAGWVRKEVDLTTDLDTVYQKLNGLAIYGGNELVGRVCRDALVQQKWSEDKRALKMIFVCGNEAADQDREVSLEAVRTRSWKNSAQRSTRPTSPMARKTFAASRPRTRPPRTATPPRPLPARVRRGPRPRAAGFIAIPTGISLIASSRTRSSISPRSPRRS
jgi:hypothetical protein